MSPNGREGLGFRDERCVLVHALAPDGTRAADAHRAVNSLVADDGLPTALWHDHFLGDVPGGVIVFHVPDAAGRDALAAVLDDPEGPLAGWRIEAHGLIYSRTPAGFDGQTAYTLGNYADLDWEDLRRAEAGPD